MGDAYGMTGSVAGINLHEFGCYDTKLRILDGVIYRKHEFNYYHLGPVDMITKEQCSLTATFDYRKGHRLWPFHFRKPESNIVNRDHSLLIRKCGDLQHVTIKDTESGKFICYTDTPLRVSEERAMYCHGVRVRSYRHSREKTKPLHLNHEQRLLRKELIHLFSLKRHSIIYNHTTNTNTLVTHANSIKRTMNNCFKKFWAKYSGLIRAINTTISIYGTLLMTAGIIIAIVLA